jgi:predicted O-methyltransferase YrrM
MDHFYKNIDSENWFNYENLYKSIVEKFNCGSHFVEVGTWKGASASFMAVEIINSRKKIKFDCVDTWDYIDTSYDIPKENYDNLFEKFLKNIEPIKDHVNLVKSISWDAAKRYQDNSIDFIFIDAGHDYESVRKDIVSWFPKLKYRGIMAGHDYNNNGICRVKQAVDEFFEKIGVVSQFLDCWIYEKLD